MDIRTHKDLGALCVAAARDTAGILNEAIEEKGLARIVLTGGTAGIRTLEELAGLDVDFTRCLFFFGDERDVNVSHPDSNEGQAREAFFSKVPVPEENIFGMDLGEGDLEEAAARYEQILNEHTPEFDLHLFGVGEDGHINSLFPGSPVLEENKLVAAVFDSPKPPARRLTLTFPAVQRARHKMLLVSGAAKAEALAKLLAQAPVSECPAMGVGPAILQVDEAARS